MPRRIKLGTTGTVVALALWTLGQITRDLGFFTGLCFYIPSAGLAAGFLLAAAYTLRRKRGKAAAALLLLSLPPSLFVGFVENRFAPRPSERTTASSLRLVHWNVFEGRLGWDAVVRELRELSADIYVLSEPPEDVPVYDVAWSLGESYDGMRLGSMDVIAAGLLESKGWLLNDGGIEAHSFVWRSSGGPLSLIVVDLGSSVLRPRNPRLQKLSGLMERERPDLVVGDLNAPRRSRALCPLPEGFRHAYDAAGSGWSYTWPVPLPVYAIDHCILGTRLLAEDYSLRSTLRSDHRLQVLDFQVLPEP